MRPRRGYSDREVDEFVKEQAIKRADERTRQRQADPRWRLVEADDGLPGLVWEMVEG